MCCRGEVTVARIAKVWEIVWNAFFNLTSENRKKFPLYKIFTTTSYTGESTCLSPSPFFPLTYNGELWKFITHVPWRRSSPKFYGWPILSVRVMCPNLRSIGPQTKIWEGGKAPEICYALPCIGLIGFLLYTVDRRECQSYFFRGGISNSGNSQ